MAARPTVAVIGGGFSGVLTALHLLADPNGPTVRLVERGAFARGAAFSTANPDHLLNVRVANMSAYPDDPGHFTRWLAEHSGWSVQDGFVTRGAYGDYLQDLLRNAILGGRAGRLLLEADEATDLEPAGEGWRVRLALGRTFRADAVVMALGVLRPAPPAGAGPDLIASPRYLADPWTEDRALPDDADDVLLIGAGLTMVDAILTHARPGRRFWALSRRGLLPQTHGSAVASTLAQPEGSPSGLLAEVRRRLQGVADWREVIDGLRPHVRDIWRRWSLAERGQFLRHLRPWWDVHRHRLAPGVARRIHTLLAAGDLKLLAGKVRDFSVSETDVTVTWAPRRSRMVRRLKVDAIINCTGMAGDIECCDLPLVRRLLDRGLIRPDPLRLGLDIDDASRVIGAADTAQPRVFAIGALTRGAFWEIVSVPDIRVQAAEVAADVLRALAQKRKMAAGAAA